MPQNRTYQVEIVEAALIEYETTPRKSGTFRELAIAGELLARRTKAALRGTDYRRNLVDSKLQEDPEVAALRKER